MAQGKEKAMRLQIQHVQAQGPLKQLPHAHTKTLQQFPITLETNPKPLTMDLRPYRMWSHLQTCIPLVHSASAILTTLLFLKLSKNFPTPVLCTRWSPILEHSFPRSSHHFLIHFIQTSAKTSPSQLFHLK